MTRGLRRPGVLGLALLISLAAGLPARAQSPTEPAQAAIGSTLTPTLLRDLPSSNNLFRLFETVEGEIISDRFYGGGLNTGRMGRDAAFLSPWEQTQYFVGDVNVTTPGGGTPFFFPVLSPWERVNVGSALMPLDGNAPGLAVGLDPARPAAKWTTVVDASGAGASLVAKPSTSIAPALSTLTQWSHAGLVVSGPVSPRTGLVAAVDWSGARQVERTGAAQADGQAASGFINLVVAPGSSDELRTIAWVQRTQAPFAGAAAFHEALAADRTTFAHVQSTWERRRPDAVWRVFGAYSQADSSRDNSSPVAPVVERLLDGPVPLLVDSGDRTDRQWSAGVREMRVHRTHTLLAGADVGRSASRIGPAFAGAVGETIDGVPARMWSFTNNGLGDAHRHITTFGVFVSDRIALGPGRTFEAGVSYDGVEGAADGAATGVSWHNVLPRVSLRWKQGESSHFTWVAGYRRSADRLTTGTLAVGDPAAPRASVSVWSPAGVGAPVQSVGPGTGLGAAADFAAISASLARPVTDEISAGIEAQLTPNVHGRIIGVAKEVRHLFDLVNLDAPASSYTTFTIIDGRGAEDGGDTPLTVYNRPLGLSDRYLLTNVAGQDTARAAALVLNSEATLKRLTLMLNATASITDGVAANMGFHAEENDLGIGEIAADPNAASFARGRLFYDRAFTLKLSGVYRFPHAITLGAIARYQDGQPFSRLTAVPGATTSATPNQGITLIRTYEAGGTRFMYTGTLDVRLQKQFTVGTAAVTVFVDAYNLPNMGNEVEERVLTGPGFRDITAIQPPATVHIGLRLHF